MSRYSLKELLSAKPIGERVEVCGWIKSQRKSKSFNFLILNDGTTQFDLQVIVDAGLDRFDDIDAL